MLTALTRRGIAWGIVTNKPERLAKIVVGNNPVISGARCVIGWDTVGKMKPAPDSLILAMKTLGLCRPKFCTSETMRATHLPHTTPAAAQPPPLGLHSLQHPAG